MSVRSALFVAISLLLAGQAASAATPNRNDYARGIAINAASGQPLIETTLPDEIYQTATRADLGDLRVFNADGVPVPHAFCSAPETASPIITQQSLTAFELRDAQRARMEGSSVEVETASGTRINVQEATGDADSPANGSIHIIDASSAEEPLLAIHFDWESPDGASQAQVRIEASEDLDHWRVVVPASTLLLAKRGAQELRRERIELPRSEYEYLRVQRADGGPALRIHAITAELVAAAPEIEPMWFMPNVAGRAENDALLFDTVRLAPVTYARLRLPRENSSVQFSLQSRPDEKAVWRERWSGESYVIVAPTERRESPPARFEPTTDRYWRVRIFNDASVHSGTLLELGYRPVRLRFLAQGAGPFTVAFGSRRADIAPAVNCNALLADVSPADRERLVEPGYLLDARVLGGDAALKPLPKKTPLRLVLLWSVLIVGVGLVVAMALALLKRVRSG